MLLANIITVEIYERVSYGNASHCHLLEVIMFNRELCRGVEPLIINLSID